MIDKSRPAADSAFQLGQALIAVGRYQDAIQLLRRAAGSEPDDAQVRCLLAAALLETDQFADGLRVARSAIALAPDQEWPHRVAAMALVRLGKGRDAMVAADQALRLDPMSPRVLHVMAEAQLAAGRANLADQTARRLIQTAPESAAGYDIRGRVALKNKRFTDAEVNFREALRLDPSSWVYNNNLGVALKGQKRKKDAVEAFERAVRANPKAGTARRNLFVATSAYVGAGGVVVFLIAIRFVPALAGLWHLPALWDDAIIFGGIIAAIVGLWLWGRYRRSQLSPSVDLFYQRELVRERNLQLLRALCKAGPIVAVALGVTLLGASGSPGFLLWLLAGATFVVLWLVFWRHLWKRFVLPHIRPDH